MKLAIRLMTANLIIRLVILTAFSGVVLVSPIAVNASNAVNITVNQVKTADSPVVYYLDHKLNKKKAYLNEAAFLSYGNHWSDVRIISSDQLNEFSNINLIKTASDPAVYYINAGKKALITSAEDFLASGFKWSDIVIVSQTDLNSYALTEFKVGGGVNDNYSGGNLTIKLDEATPKSTTLAANTSDNLVAVFNFKAEQKPVAVNGLTLSLNGVFNIDNFKKIYLTNEAGSVYDYLPSLENRQAIFNFNNDPIILQPGQESKIKVFVNLKDWSTSQFQFDLSLASSSDIKTQSQIIGNFPLKTGTFKLVDASSVLGQVLVTEKSLNLSEVGVGSTGQALYKFTISETSRNEDLILRDIAINNRGTSGKTGLSNFIIKNEKNSNLASVKAVDSEGVIRLRFNNYKIAKGESETFTLSGDVTSGAGKNINLNFKAIKISGAANGFNLNPTSTTLDQVITITRQSIRVLSKNLKETKDVFAEQAGTLIGVFEIRNANLRISLESLYLSLSKGAETANLSKPVYLVNYNTGVVLGSVSGANLSVSQAVINPASLNLNPNETLALALVTEIPKDVKNGDNYQITLNKIVYRLQSGEIYEDETNVAGEKLSIGKARLFVYANDDASQLSYTKGEKNVKIASFFLEASAGGDAVISSLNLSRIDTSPSVSYVNGFSNLRAVIGSQKSSVIAKPSEGEIIFSGLNYRVKAGNRIEIKIYVDTEIDLKTSSVNLALNGLNATAYGSNLPANTIGLGAVSSPAVFQTVSAEISDTDEGLILPDEKNNLAGSFTVKNTGGETLRLSSLVLNTSGAGFSYSLGYSNLAIKERETGRSVGGKIAKPVAGANKISLGNYKINAGEEKVFDIFIDASASIPETGFPIYLSDLQATGDKSKIKANIAGDPTTNIVVAIDTEHISFVRPLNGKITYGFHDPDYPFINQAQHTGIDIKTNQGTQVKASAAGTIVEAVDGGLNYSYIVIKHNEDYSTVYGHLSRLDKAVGTEVKKGEVIGLSGGKIGAPGSGQNTTGPHLHFEILLNGQPIDPESLLSF